MEKGFRKKTGLERLLSVKQHRSVYTSTVTYGRIFASSFYHFDILRITEQAQPLHMQGHAYHFFMAAISKNCGGHLISCFTKEGVMAREWFLEAEVRLNSKTMEERLIEAFGCSSVNGGTIKIQSTADRNEVKTEYLIDGAVLHHIFLPGLPPVSTKNAVRLR